MRQQRKIFPVVLIFVILFSVSCTGQLPFIATPTPMPTPTHTPTSTLTSTSTPTITPTPSITPTPTPDYSGITISLGDLPLGFKALVGAQYLNGTSGLQLISQFSYMNYGRLQTLDGFVALVTNPTTALDSDITAKNPNLLMQTISEILGTKVEFHNIALLNGLSGIGDKSMGVTGKTTSVSTKLRADMLMMRKGNMLAVIRTFYGEGAKPQIDLKVIGQKLEARISQVTNRGECIELIQNGDFESGAPGPWVETSSLNKPLIGQLRPHGGANSANLGDGFQRGVDESIYQEFTIPTGVMSVLLTYWWDHVTREQDGQPHDLLLVTLQGPDGKVLATIDEFNNTTGKNFEYVQARHDLSIYAGQRVSLHFHVATDAQNDSDFSIDDVSIQACESK